MKVMWWRVRAERKIIYYTINPTVKPLFTNMKSRHFLTNLLICGLLISPISPLFLTRCALFFTPPDQRELYYQNLQEILAQITVKVVTDNNGTASGTLIKKNGSVYSVITNHHVVTGVKSLQIITPDNHTYQATLKTQGDPQDLAILTFSSNNNYPVATVAKKFLKVGDKLFAGGFVKDKLKITSGQVELVLDQPLLTGHQIGYSNQIEQGMSGGAIINNKGELIGINGRISHPVVPDFTLKNGSKPDQETVKQWVNYSWGLPIFLADEIDSDLALINCKTVDPTWDIPKQVECIAEKISVRITSDTGSGSGVIIARNNDSYWVLTANHVVRDNKIYRVETADGQTYQLDNKTIQGNNISDIAVLQFKSNKDYQVATLGNYPLYIGGNALGETNEKQWIFLYGWQGEKEGHPAVFSVGLMQNETTRNFLAQPRGYELAYNNLAYPGMSGGAILDTEGRLIGIHNAGGESELLDYSFGMSIGRFLVEKFTGIPELKIEKNQPELVKDNESLQKYAENLAETAKPNKNTIYATDWLKYATQLWRLGKDLESIKALGNALNLNSDSYQLYYNAGFILLLQGSYKEALNVFDNAISLQPTFYRSYLWKGAALDGLKRYEEAIISYTKAMEEAKKDNQKQDSFLYFQRALAYKNQGKYPEAIADYTQAIKINPNDALAYNNRGLAYQNQEKYPEAIADYTQAIKLNPNLALAYNNRGIAYSNQGKLDDAIADYNQAIKINPNDAEAYYNRGIAYDNQGKFLKAIADYNQAIKINPNLAYAYYNRGLAYYKQGKIEQAIADFTQAIKINPNYAAAYNNRGLAYQNQGNNLPKAITDYTQAIKINPNLEQAYHNRGNAYLNQGKYLKAIADYTQVIKINPNDAVAYYNRGLAYYKQDNRQKAREDFQTAKQLFQQQGNTEKAQIVQGVLDKL